MLLLLILLLILLLLATVLRTRASLNEGARPK